MGPHHEPAGRPRLLAAAPAAIQQGQDEKAPEEEPEREVPTEVLAAAQSGQGHGVCECDRRSAGLCRRLCCLARSSPSQSDRVNSVLEFQYTLLLLSPVFLNKL